MKKILLSSFALAITASAWAQTADLSHLIDVTPTAYHFYKNDKIDLGALLRTDVTSPAMPNMGDFGFITNNPDLFTKENLGYGSIVFGGGYRVTQNELAKGFSTYNFGGEIGNVLILNGNESNLDVAIQDALGLEAAPEIAKMGAAFSGNINNFWLEDYYTMREKMTLTQYDENGEVVSEGDKVLLHIELSAYNNDMTSGVNVLEQMYQLTQFVGGAVDMKPLVTFKDFSVDGKWSPENWMVLEAVVPYFEAPSYIRMFAPNNAALNNGALLIRDFAIYGVPVDVDLEMDNYKLSKNFVEYSLTGSVEPEAPALYLIGGNVDGQSWTLGTNQMTYANGVYTWSGKELGQGFKINDGTWDNPDYNIGAGADSGSLSLAVPFLVVANGDAGNIVFDGFIAVENPEVVYDPVAMTVTVTGEAVYADNKVPANLYVMGNIAGNEWNPAAAVPAIASENGIFSFENIELNGGDSGTAYFTFINELNSDWGIINDGQHRYGPAAGQDAALTAPATEVKFGLGGDTSFNIPTGTYDFTVDFNTMTLCVEVSKTDGVKSLNDENSAVEYYNLQGVKVANPQQGGLYIIRKGNTTTKAVIR